MQVASGVIAQAQMLGAPGLDSETWESTKEDLRWLVPHKRRVPHPCVFSTQGWEATNPGSRSPIPANSLGICFVLAAALLFAPTLPAQEPDQPPPASPIAIVPLDSKNPDRASKVTGALEVSQGKAVIAVSGAITSGTETTQVNLPLRGLLRVCASTTVNLAKDSSVPAGEIPGLMISMDHGAIEASFATGRNSDILLTPDFRILIGGPGSADVKVRLAQHGDTCVDNAAGASGDTPYVLVTSVFDNGTYRVQPGQRVMFQHGDVHAVVDQEKEPCGCPPSAPKGNEFPLAQSEGLAPTPPPAPSPVRLSSEPPAPIEPLVYSSTAALTPSPAAEPAPAAAVPANSPAKPPAAKKKSGFLSSVGRFFRRIFGAE